MRHDADPVAELLQTLIARRLVGHRSTKLPTEQPEVKLRTLLTSMWNRRSSAIASLPFLLAASAGMELARQLDTAFPVRAGSVAAPKSRCCQLLHRSGTRPMPLHGGHFGYAVVQQSSVF